MSLLDSLPSASDSAAAGSVVVDIAVPVHNEARTVEANVCTLRRYLDELFPFPTRVTVVDNASTDNTWEVASRVAALFPGVRAVHLGAKGRGRALKAAWLASDAPVVAYMDVDLSTDLGAVLPLVAPLLSGHSDVSIGTRLAPGARVVRGPKREAISRAYNTLVRAATRSQASDAQCGFKAVRADVARALLPLVQDDGWFFDTELLVLAARNGLRVHEVPVDWVDDPDSRVDVLHTALEDLRGLGRLTVSRLCGRGRLDPMTLRSRGGIRTAQQARIGGASTVAYLALFLLLQLGMSRVSAAALALTVTAVGHAAAYWRTVADPALRWALGRISIVAWAAGVTTTAIALVIADRVSGSLLAALVAVLAINVAVSAGRLLAVRAMPFESQ
jgi:hypothetical protein